MAPPIHLGAWSMLWLPFEYRTFGKVVECKKYLCGVSDAGTKKITHGQLGRHRGREGRKECLLLCV